MTMAKERQGDWRRGLILPGRIDVTIVLTAFLAFDSELAHMVAALGNGWIVGGLIFNLVVCALG